jgi:D-serine deaminase-like pyridoxal phosphate-dependent protein
LNKVDSPALVVDEAIVAENIRLAIEMIGEVDRLRPHVKTHKMGEVCRLMMEQGITRFKCATIAEAEMLAMVGAPDVLLAYQPVGVKVERLLNLVAAYPVTRFSCLLDSAEHACAINEWVGKTPFSLDVFIDLNVGMNRTGARPLQAIDLARRLRSLKHLRLTGLHGYDGHIHDTDLALRQQAADVAFAELDKVYQAVQPWCAYPLKRVAGGTPTFPIHARRPGVECSPGTFVFWDWGYGQAFPDMPFQYAAWLLCRVVSVIDERRICLDLGYKAVASENPLPRVHYIYTPEVIPVAQSEEHLVAETPDSRLYPLGSTLYGLPTHICPTVALYEKAFVVRGQELISTWRIQARDRCITI